MRNAIILNTAKVSVDLGIDPCLEGQEVSMEELDRRQPFEAPVDKEKIEKWVRWTFDTCGLNLDDYRWAIEYSDRMTWAMGYADHKQRWNGPSHDRQAWIYLMTFSLPLFERATEQEQYQTVVHEACHIIDYINDGGRMHGKSWKKLMVRCGLEPTRCHNVDRTGLKRVVPCKCKCDTWTEIGQTRASRIRRGTKYRCQKCKSYIKLIYN